MAEISIEMTEQQNPAGNNAVKIIDPKGDVLNDNGVNVDYLGRVVYAKALAQQIERIKTPVTIGVFARWGTGKSFLLKQVKRNLMAMGANIVSDFFVGLTNFDL